jgi:hypothetical protein
VAFFVSKGERLRQSFSDVIDSAIIWHRVFVHHGVLQKILQEPTLLLRHLMLQYTFYVLILIRIIYTILM